ncbi:adenosine deaminase [Micromonospora sp. NPDC047670]|uniref:adenosine deaminase n=1 Tax=Micromonospora sp. NPDC047670 TaxID=3364252 RepID=UPI003720B2FB
MTREDDVATWIAALPKVELHLHLEGSLRPATLFRLAERNGVDVGATSADELAERYTFNNFGDFAALFFAGLSVLRTADDFTDAVVALAAELAEQNVRYAEVTTTPINHHRRGVALEEYRDGLDEGRRRARDEFGVELGWVCDISRESEDPASEFTVGFLLGAQAPDGVVGLGLGGVEDGFPPELFASSFARARANGLAALPHAGETVGPGSIWGAVRALGAARIGHGIRCLEDPALVEHLATHRIPLEVAVTSNTRLKLVDGVDQHPLTALLDAGLVVTLNTDDPAYFRTTLTEELQLAHRVHGVGRQTLLDMQLAALRASCADSATKSRIRDALAAV